MPFPLVQNGVRLPSLLVSGGCLSKVPQTGALEQQEQQLLSQSGSLKPAIEVPGGHPPLGLWVELSLAPQSWWLPASLAPGSISAASACHQRLASPHISVFTASSPFFQGQRPYWVRAHPNDLILPRFLSAQITSHSEVPGAETPMCLLRGQNSTHNIHLTSWELMTSHVENG